MRIAVPDTKVIQKCFGIWNRFSLWLQHLVKKNISRYLKVSQGTGPVSQATGLRRWYLKLRGWNLSISRYLKVQGRYLKLRGWNLSISRYLKVQGRYLKLRGYGDGISSYGAGI